MHIKLSGVDVSKAKKTVVLLAKKGPELLSKSSQFDKHNAAQVEKALKATRFKGANGQVMVMPTPNLDDVDRVIVVGLGAQKGLKEGQARVTGITLGKELDKLGTDNATVIFENPEKSEVGEVASAKEFLEGINLSLYRFEAHKTAIKADDKAKFKTLTLMTEAHKDKDLVNECSTLPELFEGVKLTRDMINQPANIVNADTFVKEAQKLKKLGIEVKIMRDKELKKAGLDLMLSVNKGAAQEAALIIMKWTGAGKKDAYKAIVGKGVTFDSGGYSLKPSDGMVTMKADMGGAGAVIGTMRALAGRKTKANVIGVCGCVENMVNEHANRPSDVVKSYKGLTVEINNTDAEGRLVLADALAYIIDKEKPSEVIDLATLTGACMIALGNEFAGLFSNNDDLVKELTAAGKHSGENVWRLPITPGYHKQLKSSVADLSNIGTRWGGASTAAAFLERFVGKTKWAHIDIAGVALAEKTGNNLLSGATGFGVRLLTRYYEKA